MSDADLTDLCRQIATEHAERVVGGAARSANGADPLALVGRLDAYGEAVQGLSTDIADQVKEESRR
jgi:hypothetical protein